MDFHYEVFPIMDNDSTSQDFFRELRRRSNSLRRINQNLTVYDPLMDLAGPTKIDNFIQAAQNSCVFIVVISASRPSGASMKNFQKGWAFYNSIKKNRTSTVIPVFVGFRSECEATDACPSELNDKEAVMFVNGLAEGEDELAWRKFWRSVGVNVEPEPRHPVQETHEAFLSMDGPLPSIDNDQGDGANQDEPAPSHSQGAEIQSVDDQPGSSTQPWSGGLPNSTNPSNTGNRSRGSHKPGPCATGNSQSVAGIGAGRPSCEGAHGSEDVDSATPKQLYGCDNIRSDGDGDENHSGISIPVVRRGLLQQAAGFVWGIWGWWKYY